MQTRDEPGKSLRYSFDSLGELGEYIARTKRVWSQTNSETGGASASWDLNTKFPAAVELARNGWLEGADKVQDALKAFNAGTPQPDCKVDFYGFRPHVPRFCAGAPDSMIRHAPVATIGSGRVLTLAVPVNANSSTGAGPMANFGVAVAQYVNQLESDGMRVEVIGMICSKVHAVRVTHSWIIKNADQPLDLAVLAFSIGHPAMFRRLGFALRERCSAREMPGYGEATAATVSDLINPAPGTVILNGMKDANTYAPTPEAALAYVERMIDKAIAAQELPA